MSEVEQSAAEAISFSIDDAVNTMLPPTRETETSRAVDGRFAPKDAAAERVEEPAKVVDLKTGKPPEAVKAEPVEEEDEDLEFEIPAAEEGKEASRVKLSQLYEGYEKAGKLEAELAKIRETAPPPVDYTTAISETMHTVDQYRRGLDALHRTIVPSEPSLEMLNEASEHYNPSVYYAKKQQYENDRDRLFALRNEFNRATAWKEQNEEVLRKAGEAKVNAHLASKRPELKDGKAREALYKQVSEAFGFGMEELQQTLDPRAWDVVLDALEFRASKAKQVEAVKVVRQKPKLVKGAARSTTTGPGPAKTAAMSRFNQTFSIDDAVEALISR